MSPSKFTIILISAMNMVLLHCVSIALAQSESNPWDVHRDGVVDMADLIFVGKNFGGDASTGADINSDGIVNILDLVLVGRHLGEKYGPYKEIIGKDGAPMVLIPAGEFQMGYCGSEFLQPSSEIPRHIVYLDAFYMDKYEVTNAQYKRFVQATGHREPEGYSFAYTYSIFLGSWIVTWMSGFEPWSDKVFNGDNQPVVCVSWEDAKAYCQWAGKRLPTEAEWEKAARGGMVGVSYVWGDSWTPPKNAGNFADEALRKVIPRWTTISGYDDGYAYTAPVNSFTPNGYDLHNIAGNVREWCADWYDDDYYEISPKQNPKGPDSGVSRILRGGAWNCTNQLVFFNLRVSNRDREGPTWGDNTVGFRCVQDLK